MRKICLLAVVMVAAVMMQFAACDSSDNNELKRGKPSKELVAAADAFTRLQSLSLRVGTISTCTASWYSSTEKWCWNGGTTVRVPINRIPCGRLARHLPLQPSVLLLTRA